MKAKQYRSLAQAIFSNQVLLVAISALVVGPLVYLVLLIDLEKRSAESNRILAGAVAGQVSEYLRTPQQLLYGIDMHYSKHLRPPLDYPTQEMDELIDRTAAFDAIYILSPDNETLAVGLPLELRERREDFLGLHLGASDFIDKARDTDTYQWSDVFLSVMSSTSIGLALPLTDGYMLVGHFNLERLSRFVAGLQFRNKTLALITDGRGQLTAAPDFADVQQQVNISNLTLVRRALNGQHDTQPLTFRGQKYLASSQRIDNLDWVVIVASPEEKIAEDIRSTFLLLFIGAVFSIGLAATISRLLAKELAAPFVHFIQVAHELQAGKLEISMPHSNLHEVKLLNDSLERMARNLREQMEFMRTLLDTVPSPVYYKDKNGIYLGCNQAFEDFFNLSQEQLLHHTANHASLPVNQRLLAEGDDLLLRHLSTESDDLYLNLDGSARYITLKRRSFADAEGEVAGIVGVIYDLTERVSAERESQQLRLYLDNIIDSMPSVLFTLSRRLTLVQMNRACRQRLHDAGIDQPEFSDLMQHFGLDIRWINEALAGNQTFTLRRHPQSTSERFEDITIYPLDGSVGGGAVLRIDDVTEQVGLEEVMVQSEKMISVAGLAAGMAHEINNPLAGIVQTSQLLRVRLDPDFPANWRTAERCGLDMNAITQYLEQRSVPQMLEAIEESGQRASQIVRNMLDFSRKTDEEQTLIAPEKLLQQSIQLAANDYDLKKNYDFRDIQILNEFSACPEILCNPSKLQQVFFNLLKNSAQAMAAAQTENPTITIRLNTDRDNIQIQFSDNGPGIPSELLKRVFEPFFTTKKIGVGTGLGLSVSYFIITENHGGKIWVDSVEGQGSIFNIELPIK